jgi:cell wall-associated NlpC family hydrolase
MSLFSIGADAAQAATSYNCVRATDPARTIVTNAKGSWVATFTDCAFTVTVRGPQRTFAEATASHPVKSTTWVRLLPAPFDGAVDMVWLEQARADTSPDLLAIAMQYTANAPARIDENGLTYAGDAAYGPLQADGTRQEGSDFNDYLGISRTYENKVDKPEAHQFGSLDCSGFVRMVFGYRGGMAMTLARDANGTALPRRAVQMAASAPGVLTIPDSGTRVSAADLARLAPGDLVFFDVSTDDGTLIDHVGIYLGKDTAGNHRLISSRKTANGPTLGDSGGRSVLNGSGLYAVGFRAARRV